MSSPQRKVRPKAAPRPARARPGAVLLPESPLATSRILRLAGLGVRGRGAIVGQERVREAARSGRLALALVAADASVNTRQKLLPLLSARRVTLMEVPSAADLGAAVGRQQTAAVGILDPNLAEGICMLGAPVRRVDEEGV